MATLQKRGSENQMLANTEAGAVSLKRSKSSEPKTVEANTADAIKSAVARTSDCLAAWGAGRFDVGDVDAALAEFFTEDFVLDASSAAHSGVAAYKLHNGFAGLKEWFAFCSGFDFGEMEMVHVAGPAPNEVWMRFTVEKAVWKATGKSAPLHCINVFTWEGDKATKMTAAVYNPASIAAIMSEEDIPIPSPVQLPAFEPHQSPMEPFGELMALWGAGEFNKPEVRSKYCAADCVDDCTDAAFTAGLLGDVFKAHVGLDGMGVWMEHQTTKWEMSNIDVAPVVGLRAGCVTIRFTCDLKHTITGKEAKGVQMYNELAYNANGQFVYVRHYFVNAPLLASIYN